MPPELPSPCHASLPSPVGELFLAATDRGLSGVWIAGEKHCPSLAGPPVALSSHPVLTAAAVQLQEYFAGHRREFDLPLDMAGTPFQQEAWRALCSIPFGETRSYRQQAAAIGKPAAVRAVGTANGSNPVSIIVPCHRVIGANGSLTGYGGGLPAKRWLLDHESKVAANGLL